MKDEHPKPLSDEDFALAMRFKEIFKRYGSLAAFFKHIEDEKRKAEHAKYEQQMKAIHGP